MLQNAVKHTYSSLGFQNFSGGNTPGAPAYEGRGGKGREGRDRGEEGGNGPHNNVCLRAPTNLNPALWLPLSNHVLNIFTLATLVSLRV